MTSSILIWRLQLLQLARTARAMGNERALKTAQKGLVSLREQIAKA